MLKEAFRGNKAGIALAILLFSTINFVAWMWVVDWAIWYDTPWIYVPLVAWNIEISKGEAINVGYWMICLSLVFACVSAYVLGRTKK